MKVMRIAINGFGRIGRTALRAFFKERYEGEVVAINTGSIAPAWEWAHCLRRDSLYRLFPQRVEAREAKEAKETGRLLVGNQEIALLGEREPAKIPWKKYKVDVVLECTGVFRDKKAGGHLKAGAKKVILSAPAKTDDIPLIILGVNEDRYRGEKLISNGSCTTNCAAPIVKVIDEAFGFEEGILTTIHSYTSNQGLVDRGAGEDLRRMRAAGVNIVPTHTGAAEAVIKAYPEAKGRFTGTAIRVPVLGGSYSDITFKLKRKTNINEVNKVLEEAAVNPRLAGRLKISYEPLVSSDILGNSASALVDSLMTRVVSRDMISVAAWYDNEYGYCCRLWELAILTGREGKKRG